MKQFKFDLGLDVRDKVTGYSGVILGRTEYLTGCLQYGLLNRNLDEKGEPKDWCWYDETRLEIIEAPKINVESSVGGPSEPAPSMN